MRLAVLLLALALVCLSPLHSAEPVPLSGSPELHQLLDRLNTLGSMLMLGAHPDDENTAVIAHFSRGRHIRSAYLSATRGEGGQNLIGPEQGALMGVIRTQELLEARRIDGGEQYFTRAIDFGYSKTPEETIEKWGRDTLLGDMVRMIRQFQPDVIVARFAPAPGTGGHGHHTAVGHIGPEAFEAAADPARFPEHFDDGLEPWQAKRYYWNVFQFGRPRAGEQAEPPGRLTIDTGVYDPILGKSYAQIAGESRSMHRSQSMGTGQRAGSAPALFDYVAGEQAQSALFDGIETSWNRVPGAAKVGALLARAREQYRPSSPEKILPLLLEAYRELESLEGSWPDLKRRELARAIELASGVWLDARAAGWKLIPGKTAVVELTVVRRLDVPLRSASAMVRGFASKAVEIHADKPSLNAPAVKQVELPVPADAPHSQPPWLRSKPAGDVYHLANAGLIGRPEADPELQAEFQLTFDDGVTVPVVKEVSYRWVDPARGEQTRAIQIVPEVAVSLGSPNLIFPSAEPKNVSVRLISNVPEAAGSLRLHAPQGWTVSPESQRVEFGREGQEKTVEFSLTPPVTTSGGRVIARLELGGKSITSGMQTIAYDHIPIQMVYPEAEMRVERFDVKLLSKKIGYVMGAGDDVPAALEQLGAEVTLLGAADLASGDLSRFDAVVTGVRALNTRPDLLTARERVLDYVSRGGTLVVQYNTVSYRRFQDEEPPTLAPYPLKPFASSMDRHDRVVDEAAPVRLLLPGHQILNAPNRITESDFDSWVQERGLYFMEEWDERYEAVWASNDPGQEPQPGGMLFARYGDGVYIFSAYAWFRQLPAGVPGAYRIFANLVSAGKVR